MKNKFTEKESLDKKLKEFTGTIETLKAGVLKHQQEITGITKDIHKQILDKHKIGKTKKRYPNGRKNDGRELTIPMKKSDL